MTLGQVQLFLQQGTPSPAGCEVNFVVGDADALFAFHGATGVDVVEPPGDREYGLRDYSVRDLDGYELGFGHYLYNDGPPGPDRAGGRAGAPGKAPRGAAGGPGRSTSA